MKSLMRQLLGVMGLVAGPMAEAATLTFDADTGAVGAQDGGGVWDAAGTNWWDGATHTNWNDAAPDSAIFGAGSGAAGVVTILGTRTAGGLTFNAAGSGTYILSGGPLTLAGSPAIVANASADIDAPLSGGAGFLKTGAGVLTLRGANTVGGGLTLAAGTLAAASNAAALGAGGVTLAGGDLTLGVADGQQAPVALAGWTADMIVEKTAGSPSAGQNASVASWAYYEKGAPNSAQGLPSNGTITSAVNPSVVFQLQPFTSNNIVINNGRLNLVTPASYGQLQLLMEGQGTPAVFNILLGFADGSTTAVFAASLPDWTVSGNNAHTNFGLVTAANTGWTGFYTNFLALYETDINLSPADRRKTLASVTLQSVQNNSMLLAVSGQQAGPYANELAAASNAVVTVTSPGGAALGNLAVGATTLAVGGHLQLGGAALSGAPAFSVAAGGSLAFSGAITGGFGLAKSGNGTLLLAASNSFTGPLLIHTGAVRLAASEVVPDGAGAGDVTADGVLELGGFNETINGLHGGGAVDGAAVQLGTNSPAVTNTLTVGANDASGSFTGLTRNSGGTLALVKTGAGTQVLGGGGGHGGGTYVNGGVLQLAAASVPAMTVTNPRIWLDAADIYTNGTVPAHGAAVTGWYSKGTLGGLGTFTNASRTNVATLANHATFLATNLWFRNRPAVHFEATADGSSDWQALMNGVNFASTNVTLFLAGRLSGTANQRMTGAMQNNWLFGGHGGSRGDLYLNNWVYDATAASLDYATYVYTAMKQGSLGQAWENGALRASAISGNTQGPNQWRLGGGTTTNSSEYTSCDIAEVLLFDRALTEAERVAVEAYLMQKYLQPVGTLGGLGLAAGATLDQNGESLSLGALTGTGGLTNSGPTAALGFSRAASNEFSGTLAGPVSLQKMGTGILTLGGALPNALTASNLIVQGAVYLAKPGGSALPGELVFDNTLSPDVYTVHDNQLSPDTVVSFLSDAGDHGRLELLGTTQTVAGIRTVGYAGARGVIQNREYGPANTATSTLVLAGSGAYLFTGFLRGQNGVLGVTKTGTGTQTLFGAQITYTGPTLVSGGDLRLENVTAFGSAISNHATVELFSGSGTNWILSANRTLGGSGTYVKTGAGRVRLNNTVVTGSGLWQIQQGILNNDNNACVWTGNTANLDVSAGAVFDSRADSSTFNALTGAGWVSNSFGNGAGVFDTLTLGVAGGSGVFTGMIGDGPGSGSGEGNGQMALVKAGAGTQVLAGTNTYRGSTTIAGGTLSLGDAGSISNSPLILLAGTGSVFQVPMVGSYGLTTLQSLEGFGAVTGSITAAAGARVIPGRTGVAGTLRFGNDLTLAPGLTNYFDLGADPSVAGGGVNDLIDVGGQLTAGTNPIVINQLATLTNGSYRLFNHGTLVGGFNSNVAGNVSRKTWTLDEATPGQVNLVVGGAEYGTLVWAAYTNATWNQGLTNWFNAGTAQPDRFFDYDFVLFDDSGAASNMVNLAAAVRPTVVTVSSSSNYTFGGAGRLSGTAMLVKDGTGSLTLSNANDNTGATIISNGTLFVGGGSTAGQLGGGAVLLAAGANLTYFRSGAYAGVTNPVFGGGTVNLTSLGTTGNGDYQPVHLNNGSFSGTVNVLSSRLVPLNPQSLGGATINIVAGGNNGQIYLPNAGTYTNAIVMAGTGWGEASGNLGAIRIQGNPVIAGPITLTNNARISTRGGNGTITGPISGPYELELFNNAGAQTLTLSAAVPQNYPSTRISGAGFITVIASNANALSTGPLIMNGTALNLNGNSLVFSNVNGAGTFIQNGSATAPALLTAGADGSNMVFSGSFANAGGQGAAFHFTKLGTGSFTIAHGAATGTNLVSEGTLIITNGSLSGALVLAPGTRAIATGGGSGLLGQYFQVSPGGTAPTWFNSLTALNQTMAGYSPSIVYNSGAAGANFDFGTTGASFAPGFTTGVTGFQARWSGRILLTNSGTYVFRTSSDDGSMLWIDGTNVVANNAFQGVTTRTGTIGVAAGLHDLTIAYHQGGGGSGLFVDMAYPGGATNRLPNSLLRTTGPGIGSLAGAAGSTLLVSNGLLTIAQADATAFDGALDGDGGLLKTGIGTLTLNGAAAHTDATVVAGGTLAVNGTLGPGPVSVQYAASLSGTGTVGGAVVALEGGTLRPGGAGQAGTLAMTGTVALAAGSTNAFDLGDAPATIGGGVNDLEVIGSLVISNNAILEIAPLANLSNGTYTLIQHGGVTGAFAAVRNTAAGTQPRNLGLVYTPTTVELTVGARSGYLRWNSPASPAWDAGVSPNWFNLGSLHPDYAYAGDAILFDDTAGVATNVQLTGTLAPSVVVVDVATNIFVFGGPGTLTSLPVLVKSGAGLAVITNNNFSPALTIISNGTLQVGAGTNSGALGGPISNAATLVYFRSSNPTTLTNVHSGEGTTVFNGTGRSLESDYLLTADNSGLTGPLFVNNARLRDNSAATNDWMLGAATTILNVNTAGQVFASSATTYNQRLSLRGNGWPETGGPFGALRLSLGAVWAGDITLSNQAAVGANTAQTGTITGAIDGPFALVKLGAGVVTLGGTSAVTVPRVILNHGQLYFAKAGGAPAVPAGGVMQMGAANANQPYLRMGASGQFGDGAVLVTSNTFNNWVRFDLLGTTQTLAGVNDTLGGLVIQNGGSGLGVSGDALLVISNATDNTLLSHLRDFDTINAGGRLGLAKHGAGTLTIGQVPSIGARAAYSGDTAIHGGTLKLDNATAWGSRLLNASTVELYAAVAAWSLPAWRVLTGSGTYLKTGTGTVSLLNVSNSASGRLRIQQGALRNESNACNWSNCTAALDISAGALLDMRADSVYLDALTGAGTLTNSYGNGAGTNDVLVIGVANGSGVFGGRIQDGGSGVGEGRGSFDVVKAGTGTQVLAGACAWAGPTRVDGGTLRVDGTLGTGAVTVAAGATLGGTGVIGGSVSSLGAVAPGSSAGTLTIAQNYTQDSNAVLQIEIGGPNSGVDYDTLAVGGAVALDGGLSVTLINGYLPTTNDVFVIVTATSGGGSFAATNLPPLAPGTGWLVSNLGNLVYLSVTGAPAATGYELFALQITNGLAAPDQDADADGYANLLEYVTGGNPTNADQAARMNAARTNGLFALRFTRRTNAVDATLYVEGGYAATNNADWAGLAINSNGAWSGAATVTEDGGPELVNVTVQDTVSSATNRFLRLRVTRP